MAHRRCIRLRTWRLAVAKLPADAAWPSEPADGFVSVTRSDGERSIVCEEDRVPRDAAVEPGWRALEVAGPLDFSEIGILASIAGSLAAANVSIFAISTFDTDYVLVRETDLDRTLAALEAARWQVDRP